MQKPIVVALGILAVLAGVWFVKDTSPYTGDSQKLSPAFARFIDADFSSTGKIAIAKGKGTVELEKKNGQWAVASSHGYPADEEKIEKILTALKAVRGGDEIGTAATSHERFEVDEKKGAVVRISDATGKSLGTVVVGKSVPGGGIGTTRIFMRFGDDDATYRVESNLRSDASLWGDDAEGKNYLEKDIVKLEDEMEVQTVRITRPETDDLVLERRFREVPVESSDAEKEEGADEEKTEPETKQEEYYVVTSGTETFDVGSSEEWSARGLLNRGKTISIDDAAEPTDVAKYGLDNPQMVARLEYRKKDDASDALKSFTLSFGNAKKDEEGKDEAYYFMIDDQVHTGQIFTIATYKFDGWNKEVKDFLPKEEEDEEDEEDEQPPSGDGETVVPVEGPAEAPVDGEAAGEAEVSTPPGAPEGEGPTQREEPAEAVPSDGPAQPDKEKSE